MPGSQTQRFILQRYEARPGSETFLKLPRCFERTSKFEKRFPIDFSVLFSLGCLVNCSLLPPPLNY